MVLNFPKTTEFNKRVPKQKFYEHLTVSPDLRRAFVEQIKAVIWRNKLAADTLNIAAGEQVLEVEVFLVQLTGREVPEVVLRQIDKEISYHILFLLEFEGEYQAWIGYKEAAAAGGKNAFKVDRYYHTDWLAAEDLPLQIAGLDMDAVYDNLVRQIAGERLQKQQAAQGESLQEAVEREKQRQQLEKQILALEKKIKREKQFNRQVEMNSLLKKLRKELEAIK